MAADAPFFAIDGMHTYLGKGHVLDGVSLRVDAGEMVALLGRNGVGKSTTLKSIMALTPPHSGSVRFKGRDLGGLRPYAVCRLGIGYVPEERRIFPHLTVRQNLMIGLKPGQRGERGWGIDKIYSYFPRLAERDRQKGGTLSGGEQQMLTLGRTLAGDPELVLVDEPTEGLSPLVVAIVVELLRQVNREGRSVLLVEHAMTLALGLVTRAYVMSKGRIVFDGASHELQANDEVRRQYLEV